ncbi:hypothetical protein D3C86_1993750 [compost metagenome]
MKYIVTETEDGTQDIFIFDKQIHHDCFAEMVARIKNQSGGNWERVRRTPIAAGFYDGKTCYGHSETLKLRSRGAKDEELIK